MDIRVSNQPVPTTSVRTSFSGSVFEVIFLLVVIIVAYFYLVSPKKDEYNTVKAQLVTLKKNQETIEAQKVAFDRLVQELDSEPEGVAALEQTLPLDSKPSRLYVLMENIMQGAGLTTGSVTIDSNGQLVVAGNKADPKQQFAAEHKVQSVAITVSAVGTVDQLNGFLNVVETSTRLLEVTSLDVSQGRGDQLSFRIGMKAFLYTDASGQ